MNQSKITIGDVLLDGVENSDYFKLLYDKLLIAYGEKVFSKATDKGLSTDEINDLLRFADILSNSNVSSKVNSHRNVAQEIVIMLHYLYANSGNETNEKIVKYSYQVMHNVSNYAGANKMNFESGVEEDYLSSVFRIASMAINEVPTGTNSSLGEREFFSDAQFQAIGNLLNRQYYSFSAPTSMGKTYIIRNFLSRKLNEKSTNCIVIILPTKALINEVQEDLLDKCGGSLAENNYVIISIPDQIKFYSTSKKILVFTPERVLQAFNEGLIDSIDYLFVDEAQKVFEKDERAPFYYSILDKINSRMPYCKIYFSSPYSKNPEELLKLISNPFIKNRPELASSNVFDFSPVSQKQFIVDCQSGTVEIFNSLRNQHSVVFNGPTPIDWKELIYSQSQKGVSIVYCKSKNDVVKYANEYASILNEKAELTDEVNDLIKNTTTDINKDYYLIPLLKKGVAFHIGVMPAETRKDIESIVKKRKGIDVVFCTSTLLEGVNIPAVNIFVLSHKKSTTDMSVLEFKNLIGRAGRIRYSLWGNAFLLTVDKKETASSYRQYFVRALEKDEIRPEVQGYKSDLVDSLFCPDYKFVKKNSYKNLSQFIMYRNILAESLLNRDSTSAVYMHYKPQIDKAFDSGKQIISFTNDDIEDLCYPPEIIRSIKEKIEIGEALLPQLSHIVDDEREEFIIQDNKDELNKFFEQLYALFRWDIFENKRTIGSINNISHFANLTARWISGQRLSKIILSRIVHYTKQGYRYNLYKNDNVVFHGTVSEKNDVIMEVMDELENCVKYSLSNYVKTFVKIYKKVYPDDTKPSISDYIDYGTMNDIIIQLQKAGLSRELSKEIYSKESYSVDDAGRIYVKSSESLSSSKYKDELESAFRNLRDLFID